MKQGSSTPLPKKQGFVFVARVQDFREGVPMTVRIMGKPVSAFRRADGTYFAREMGCKHQGADLSTMPLQGTAVTCARHGWQFDLTTGRCLNRDAPPLREHEVAVEEDAVFVSLFPVS